MLSGGRSPTSEEGGSPCLRGVGPMFWGQGGVQPTIGAGGGEGEEGEGVHPMFQAGGAAHV